MNSPAATTTSKGLRPFTLHWAPTGGTEIAKVYARTARAAIRKAPKPYSRYLGEIYAVEVLT